MRGKLFFTIDELFYFSTLQPYNDLELNLGQRCVNWSLQGNGYKSKPFSAEVSMCFLQALLIPKSWVKNPHHAIFLGRIETVSNVAK